jgi:asparagine synthase (glutamine-hydrolysing)
MCGIAGIFHYRDRDRVVDEAKLRAMTASLTHRGPDDEGFLLAGNVGLGHRRLTIVDLTATGHQPMATNDRSCWITYNGEFYNHQVFRKRLEQRGVRFRGTSDTETLLNVVAELGPDALAETAGIFAFAFWNERDRTLTLARDPLGVKQLYIYDDGETLMFASEMKALIVGGAPRAIDPAAVNQYLHFHTPLFERTFFKDIRQLLPGEILVASQEQQTRRRYWQITEFERENDEGTQARELEELLQTVVAEQLMADVPVGSFFSGGIDSTAAAEFARRAGKKPTCFGVHFSDQGVIDERPFQESAARALGLDLELITVDGRAFPEDFMRLMYFQDQPVIGPAMIPMYHVSRLAARKVKVCLGGQGADEIFGGYARYALSSPGAVLGNWLRRTGGGASGGHVGGNLKKQLLTWRNLRRLARIAIGGGDWKQRYFENFAVVPQSQWKAVFADESLVSRSACREIFHDTVNASPARHPGDKVMHWDAQTYLPGLFQQDDRMSMANSLESRVPLADPRVVRFAFRLDFDLKFRGGASKWILRQALAGVIPDEVLNRRKVGFDTPVRRWINELHPDFKRDLLTSQAARDRGLWDRRGVDRLLDARDARSFDVLWKVMSIEAWARQFLDASSAPAAVDTALAEPLHVAS